MVPADPQAPTPLIRIGELSRRSGVRPDAIRAWERRYGLLDPMRSPGGYRLYSAADQAVVAAMRDLTARGIAAAEAAVLARDGGGAASFPAGAGRALDPVALGDRLLAALEAFDEPAANAILDRALAGLSLDSVAEELLLPAMSEIGNRWERGEFSVAQEHFATTVVRGRLLGLARGWGAGSGPLAVLACLPGDRHDLGLLCFGLCLREHGWRIAYLGPDTPIETLEETVGRIGPRAVVLAVSQRERLSEAKGLLGSLARRVPVALGGAGVERPGAIDGVTLLPGGPAEEARALASRLRGA
jgi:MerR family transcriptional regulator, light-induced transcriptional regulator